jgi:ribosomal protein S18 acetylase RimI-like enzyme
MITITTVPESEQTAAIDTIVSAFSADPVARWFYPDLQQCLEQLPSFVKAFAGAAFEHGSADCVDGCSGAALWLPPGVHPDEKALVALLERTIPECHRTEVFALLEQMDRRHPSEPHWYLPMIGVVPSKQGNGYGSALLRHALNRCDGDRKLAYLEASSAESSRLYRRHGFELLGTIQVGSSPPLFPMLRRPRRPAAAEAFDLSAGFGAGASRPTQ